MRRIAVLWSEFPPYVAACVQALAMREGVDVFVARYAHPGEKPFDESARDLAIPVHTISAHDPLSRQWTELYAPLKAFEPDAAVVSGWAVATFNRAARYVRQRGGTVICTSDNPWRGNLKHTLGAFCAKPLFRRRYAALFVPGERARPLANALGFTGKRLITGSYSCDWPLYAGAYARRREGSGHGWPRAFIFVGSLIERKGLPDIIEAYKAYRREVDNPWELWVVGDGPLRSSLDTVEGTVPLGFKQPVECAELMARAGALILASHSEPWGVVIHEAAAAGLPVLCTDVCGAAADLVSDGHNGYRFQPGDADHLRALMVRLTKMSDQALEEMGRNSHELSKQFTPELWAGRLLRGLERLGG